MPRILCIDYGGKRTGIAVTDELQIIATPLTTIPTHELIVFLKKYISEEKVELLLIGYPVDLNDKSTHATALVNKAVQQLEKQFPTIPLKKVDERFTSKLASRAMVEMGMKKKDRQIKENTDKIAATIMLQDYLSIL
jgi:putative holliday junction resolvase